MRNLLKHLGITIATLTLIAFVASSCNNSSESTEKKDTTTVTPKMNTDTGMMKTDTTKVDTSGKTGQDAPPH